MKLRFFTRALLVLAFLPGTLQRGWAEGNNAGSRMTRVDCAEVTYRGGLVSPPQPKPEFVLTDTAGHPFDFRKDTEGYVTLLFFGYTQCPGPCPMQMSTISRALKSMPPAVESRFRVVFVTTDPERDTPAVLRSWLDHFGKDFIGLTGTQQAIDAAQIAAHLSPARKSTVRPDGGYAVGHAVFVFAYTRDNLAHIVYPLGLTTKDWIHDLPYLADEIWARP